MRVCEWATISRRTSYKTVPRLDATDSVVCLRQAAAAVGLREQPSIDRRWWSARAPYEQVAQGRVRGPVSTRSCVFHEEKTRFDNGPRRGIISLLARISWQLSLLRYDLSRGPLSGDACAGALRSSRSIENTEVGSFLNGTLCGGAGAIAQARTGTSRVPSTEAGDNGPFRGQTLR